MAVLNLLTNASWNASNSSQSGDLRRNEDLAKVEILIQCVILFFAVFGNAFVILVLALRRKKMTRMNILIVHLAIADLFVAFFNILPQLVWDITYRFYGNDFLCRSVKYVQVVAMYASAYVLVTTALDRYLVICHPLTIQTWSTRRVHLLVLVAWIVSLVFSLPQLLIFGYREVSPDSDVYDCWAHFNPIWTLQLYITWFTCAVFVIPAVMLCLLYGRICLTVWRSIMGKEPSTRKTKSAYQRVETKESPQRGSTFAVRDCRQEANPRAHVRVLSRSKVKTVKLTLTVVACYLLCWGPFIVAQMWAAWDENAPINNDAMVIVLLLASLNSCTNPWIYMAFSDNLCARITQWRTRSHSGNFTRGTSGYDSEYRQKMSLLSRTEMTRYESTSSSPVSYGQSANHSQGAVSNLQMVSYGQSANHSQGAVSNLQMDVLKKESMVSLTSNNTPRIKVETLDDSSYNSTEI